MEKSRLGRVVVLSTLMCVVLDACAQPAPPIAAASPPPAARVGAFGLDLAAGDPSVAAGDNFYLHASGAWLKANPIPPDHARWGTFDVLRKAAEEHVREIVDELAARGDAVSPLERKLRDHFRAFMDEAAIEAAGLTPLRDPLARIAAAKTHAELLRVVAEPGFRARMPIATSIALDQKDPDRYVVSVTHAGLGLPEREYYLKEEPRFADIRARYLAHIERMLTLGEQQDAAAKAKRILALETEIATLHWKIADRRDRDRTYNRRSRGEAIALLDGYPFEALLEARGLGSQPALVIRELDAMPKLAALYRATPLSAWKEYMTFACISEHAPLLPKALTDADFDFYGRTLNGQPEQRERWKRAVAALSADLGEALGELYVARHFPPDAKQKMLELVENVRRAYAQRIEALPWMTPETKVVAQEKLAAFRVKVGYPDTWRDYGELEIRPDDPIGNARRAAAFEYRRRLARIDGRTDRDEWSMTPQTVNAYYNSTFNEIVFPAAILQPPFFDPNADPAINYGAIGAVIGHEMGHGFDDQGSKSDAKGMLRTWWSPADVAAFKELTGRLADQYAQFEPLPGLKVNGRLTLGENIGDNGGVAVALLAYRLSLGGRPAPVLANLSGEQRFFLAYAQVWRTHAREEALRNQVLTDSHSPPEFRVNGVVRNLSAWYEAFGVKPGDRLYLPPEERVTIW